MVHLNNKMVNLWLLLKNDTIVIIPGRKELQGENGEGGMGGECGNSYIYKTIS